MKKELKERIYKAQCIGNVEPIEYMIPYPSMRSLIEGQNIKFSQQVIFNNPQMTNLQFYEKIHQTAHWLDSIGFKPKDYIKLTEMSFPQTEVLLFAIWQLGAIAVIPSKHNLNESIKQLNLKNLIPMDMNLFDLIKGLPKEFSPKYKPLLDDEALITFEKGIGIRLSHYNLLVNTNSIQKALNIKSRTSFSCTLKSRSAAWVILKAILPIYCGCIFDEEKAKITIGESNCDINIRTDLENISKYNETDLAICPENGAVLALGQDPMHLTKFQIQKDKIKIQGHSLMMGYLDNNINDEQFHDGAFFLQL